MMGLTGTTGILSADPVIGPTGLLSPKSDASMSAVDDIIPVMPDDPMTGSSTGILSADPMMGLTGTTGILSADPVIGPTGLLSPKSDASMSAVDDIIPVMPDDPMTGSSTGILSADNIPVVPVDPVIGTASRNVFQDVLEDLNVDMLGYFFNNL